MREPDCVSSNRRSVLAVAVSHRHRGTNSAQYGHGGTRRNVQFRHIGFTEGNERWCGLGLTAPTFNDTRFTRCTTAGHSRLEIIRPWSLAGEVPSPVFTRGHAHTLLKSLIRATSARPPNPASGGIDRQVSFTQ